MLCVDLHFFCVNEFQIVLRLSFQNAVKIVLSDKKDGLFFLVQTVQAVFSKAYKLLARDVLSKLSRSHTSLIIMKLLLKKRFFPS